MDPRRRPGAQADPLRAASLAAVPARVHPAVSRRASSTGRHEDRELADLLWFPTGGGKTEAYLGLIAFTRLPAPAQARRCRGRRRDRDHALHAAAADDPAVRAGGAADLRLRGDPATRSRELGEQPISIGLWVGPSRHARTPSPNAGRRSTSSATATSVAEGEPGAAPQLPVVRNAPDRMATTGSTTSRRHAGHRCRNRDGVRVRRGPAGLRRRRGHLPSTGRRSSSRPRTSSPTLPGRPRAGTLFNLGTPSPPARADHPGRAPPDLRAARHPRRPLRDRRRHPVPRDGRAPKVIASTATIRRADDQTQGLFAREMRQFPPPGLDAATPTSRSKRHPTRRGPGSTSG